MSLLVREVMWTPARGLGFERLRMQVNRNVKASGRVNGMDGRNEFRLTYEITCDAFWRVRRLRLRLRMNSGARTERYLRADGSGNWTDGAGQPLPALNGCIDVDISATPFTNTLPIRRLALRRGESAEFPLVYVEVPSLTLRAVRQRYTCLERHATAGALYRFEALPSDELPDGFTALLPVDGDGLVLDYPDLFRRVRDV